MKKLIITLLAIFSIFTIKTITASADEITQNQAMINYAEDVENPIFDDCNYEEYISLDSDLRSDLVLLKAPFSEYLNSSNNQNNQRQIITFSNAYYKENDELKREIVFYLYTKDFTRNVGDLICFDTVIQSINGEELGDNESMRVGKVLNKYENIYKVLLTDSYMFESPRFSLRKILLNKENVVFDVVSLYNMTSSDSNNLMLDMKQQFNFMNAVNKNARTTQNIRGSSCIVINEKLIETKGKFGCFVFDSADNLNVFKRTYLENDFRLYLYFFDVFENGEKWTNLKKMKSIEYTYNTFYNDNKHYYNDDICWRSERGGKNLGVQTKTVINEKYEKAYPIDCGVNTYLSWLGEKYTIREPLSYYTLFNVSDTDFRTDLSKALTYDSYNFNDYTFGMVIGNLDGYEETKETQKKWGFLDGFKVYNKIVNHRYYDVELESLLNIVYEEFGVNYYVEVDESYIENVGIFGDKEDFINSGVGDVGNILLPGQTEPSDGIPTWLQIVFLVLGLILLVFIWNRIIYPIIKLIKKRK